jgi:chemotaxis protein methyltransferase WspC
MRLADAGKLTEAMALCDRALRHEPTCAQAYYLKGVLHDALDQADAAVTHYRKALYLDPQHRDALLHLGATLLKSGDRDGAQPLFDRAARLTGTSDD